MLLIVKKSITKIIWIKLSVIQKIITKKNKDTLLQKHKCVCGGEFVLMGKLRHQKTDQHVHFVQYNIDKKFDLNKRNDRLMCDCGIWTDTRHKQRHENTQKLKRWIFEQSKEKEIIAY